MTDKITPVLLAGGSGSRLWPVSRDQLPKQFQPLVGNLSTYQQTLKRVSNPKLYASPLVITNEDFRFFAKRQAEDVEVPTTVVLEPARRDSAAAMAVAAVMAERRSAGSLVLALAADHVVLDEGLFSDAVKLGCEAANKATLLSSAWFRLNLGLPTVTSIPVSCFPITKICASSKPLSKSRMLKRQSVICKRDICGIQVTSYFAPT